MKLKLKHASHDQSTHGNWATGGTAAYPLGEADHKWVAEKLYDGIRVGGSDLRGFERMVSPKRHPDGAKYFPNQTAFQTSRGKVGRLREVMGEQGFKKQTGDILESRAETWSKWVGSDRVVARLSRPTLRSSLVHVTVSNPNAPHALWSQAED